MSVVTGGGISQHLGMVVGAVIVLTYTTFGGIFSVAILDFVQISVIMGGLQYIASVVSDLTGGIGAVISHAAQAGKLEFVQPAGSVTWIPFIGAWITMMFGSIPQQDVFQRITSAKDERTAMGGSVLGGILYFGFCFVPMFLAYAATLVDPSKFGTLLVQDSQLVLPTLILQHTPIIAQTLFFGAVLSAVMSCSSATLLACAARHGRLTVLTDDAVRVDRIFMRGIDDCAQFRFDHIYARREYVQGDAGGGLRPFVRRPLLVKGDDSRSTLCDSGGPDDLDRV